MAKKIATKETVCTTTIILARKTSIAVTMKITINNDNNAKYHDLNKRNNNSDNDICNNHNKNFSNNSQNRKKTSFKLFFKSPTMMTC